MDPYNTNTHLPLHVALVAGGVVVGALGYAAVAHLVLGATFAQEVAEKPPVATQGYKEVETSFVIPVVEEIEGLAGGVQTELPEDISIQLPLSVTSQEYITAFTDMLNTANKLEIQVRDRLPQALYALQEAGQAGDMSGAFFAVLEAREQNELAQSMVKDLAEKVAVFESTLPDVDPQVAAQSRQLVARAADIDASVTAFTDHIAELAVPAPPTQQQIDQLTPLTEAFDQAFQTYAQTLQHTYGVIKSAAQ